jgi:hypothetical protein
VEINSGCATTAPRPTQTATPLLAAATATTTGRRARALPRRPTPPATLLDGRLPYVPVGDAPIATRRNEWPCLERLDVRARAFWAEHGLGLAVAADPLAYTKATEDSLMLMAARTRESSAVPCEAARLAHSVFLFSQRLPAEFSCSIVLYARSRDPAYLYWPAMIVTRRSQVGHQPNIYSKSLAAGLISLRAQYPDPPRCRVARTTPCRRLPSGPIPFAFPSMQVNAFRSGSYDSTNVM